MATRQKDLYTILGVSRNASKDDIKAAYKKLVRQYHPDLNKDDREAAEERFKEIAVAYEVLGDEEKRKLYDQYGMDALRPGFDPNQAWGGGMGGMDINSIFEQMFGGMGGGRGGAYNVHFGGMGGGMGGMGGFGRPQPRRGADIETSSHIDFMTAVLGGSVDVRRDGKTFSVTIPPGVEDGKKIRLSGKGRPGSHGGPSGNLLLPLHIGSHPYYKRDGNNLKLDLPLTLGEAYLGAKVDVPTPKGTVTLTIPKGAQTGQKMRLRGRGVKGHGSRADGDLFVTLKVLIPTESDEKVEELVKALEEYAPQDVRKAFAES